MPKNANLNQDNQDLKLSSYSYDLPPELVAQRPIDGVNRDLSRLMVYNAATGQLTHDHFYNLDKYIPVDSTLVFNQSKVFPSRLLGQKNSGGRAELFLLSAEKNEKNIFPCLIKSRGKKKIGDVFNFSEDLSALIKEINEDGTFGVQLTIPNKFPTLMNYLQNHAMIPIPPYIRKGESDEKDKTSYQTLYSKDVGSVAAPTAGLHFTENVFNKLKLKKIESAFVTLHVGLGTFKPVTVDNLSDHIMHSEDYFIDQANQNKIKAAKNIFAVGTTSLRVLESSFGQEVTPNQIYKTQIFLHPGIEIQSVRGLITNFHLPESTLLMLVSALIGREKTLELYKLAVLEKYRFFSYGDAMLIIK
ncbi:MAG: tRNA preQ1(34) S-adenosylmethionine ribosyltransferase-isomerase QueA [Bacteriovoracaceae bacterium]|nr:tRNA preQ1(34) S-adenosylmethionine ribosyltransferase-isomerase QueA [Bacteriovoracaceae bacterium]